jgi:hypothetical protein
MTVRLELFLQGGLGNQLIQLAYADSLQTRTGARVRINPVLLHPIWARLRSITFRHRCWPWVSASPQVTGLPHQACGLLRLYRSRFGQSPLTDRISDAELLQRISASRTDAWHGLLGYFQRSQAFGGPAQHFWSYLKEQLLRHYSLTPFPPGQIAVHVRLGDYLRPENKRLFAHYSFAQQIRDAQQWRLQLGSTDTVHVVTDDPGMLQKLLENHPTSGPIEIFRGRNAVDDFLFLARHRHIVGSNSTFSLCSGRLASDLWGLDHVLTIPLRWYKDSDLDRQINSELNQCSFVRPVDQVVLTGS